MQLAFNDDCPVFGSEYAMDLHRILITVAHGWHDFVAPSSDRLRELVGEATWQIFGVLLDRGAKASAYSPTLYRPTDCGACSPSQVADFLTAPVVVLVENATTDGGFIHAAVSTLRRGTLSAALQGARPSVQIEHGGGIGELPKELRRLVAGRPSVLPGLPPRFVVVADSDGAYPGHRSADASTVEAVALELGVDSHILRKRSIENYVPEDALRGYALKRRHCAVTVDLVTSLSKLAWDHYPMKAGLPSSRSLSEEEIRLYPASIARDQGMGDFIADFLDNFPWLLQSSDLKQRDHDGDLEYLLSLLERNV